MSIESFELLEDCQHIFTNPWSNDPTFTNLGVVRVTNHQTSNITRFEMYSLLTSKDVSLGLSNVSLGARYSNEDSEYISGSLEFGFNYRPSSVMQFAAKQFFTKLLNKTLILNN